MFSPACRQTLNRALITCSSGSHPPPCARCCRRCCCPQPAQPGNDRLRVPGGTPANNPRCKCPVQTNTPCECPVNVPTATALRQHLVDIPGTNRAIVERFGLGETLNISSFQPSAMGRAPYAPSRAPCAGHQALFNLALNNSRDEECPAPMPSAHPCCKRAVQTPCANDRCERPLDIPSAGAPFQCPVPIPGAHARCKHRPDGHLACPGALWCRQAGTAQLPAGFSGAGGRRLLAGVRTDSAAPELLCGGRVPAHCCALRR